MMLAIKLLDQTRRRGKAQTRSPPARIESRNGKRALIPRAVKIDMQTGRQDF